MKVGVEGWKEEWAKEGAKGWRKGREGEREKGAGDEKEKENTYTK